MSPFSPYVAGNLESLDASLSTPSWDKYDTYSLNFEGLRDMTPSFRMQPEVTPSRDALPVTNYLKPGEEKAKVIFKDDVANQLVDKNAEEILQVCCFDSSLENA